MNIERQKETSPKFKEISWVSKQVKEELKRFNKEKFYEKNGEEIVYNMDIVKQYLGVLKEKHTRKELISKNSSAMIMAVQIALYSQNYSFGTIDGILGDKTKDAIKKFQADNNLPIDSYGRSLPSTIQKLLEVISKEGQVEIPKAEQQEAQEIIEEKENKDKPDALYEAEKIGNGERKNNETQGEKDGVFYTPNENMEWINAQETIHPEINTLINSYNGDGEHFKNVTELTKAEAKAICDIKSKGNQELDFSSLEKIQPDALGELLKHPGGLKLGLKTLTEDQAKKFKELKPETRIVFNNLSYLDVNTVESLAKTKGNLTFSSLKQLTPEIMEAFSSKQSGNLIFKEVKSIDTQTAEKMLNYPGNIILEGITEISGNIANILAQKPSKFYLIKLDGTKPLSDEVLDALSNVPYLQLNRKVVDQINNYKKSKRIEGKEITTPILELYESGFKNMDSLKDLKSISYDDAVLLSETGKSLDLSGVKEFSEDTFEALMKTQGTITLGLEEFPENLAKKVDGRIHGGLEFKNLKTLDVNIAQHLAHYHGELKLDSLESITPEVAKELGGKWGNSLISLNGIQEDNPQIFGSFSNYKGSVSFNNISKISEESAKVLEKKQIGKIYLDGLKGPLPDNIVPYLANNISHIFTNPESDIPTQLDKYLHPKKYEE